MGSSNFLNIYILKNSKTYKEKLDSTAVHNCRSHATISVGDSLEKKCSRECYL